LFLEQRRRPGDDVRYNHLTGRPADAPVTKVTWYDAAEFCNWLNKQEKIDPDQWCYKPNSDGKYAARMEITGGCDRKTGYRLPTEEEWEYACRGGADTSRCYGDADDLLSRYAWYAANAGETPSPVARLLPNAFGLFDMHGNAMEWCHEHTRPYSMKRAAGPESETVVDETERVNRGGSIFNVARGVRSAKRFSDRPTVADAGGFRIARSNP